MVKAVIIDDEPFVAENIAFMLQKNCPLIYLAGTAGSAVSGRTLVEEQRPDLVFLDMEMPFGNGFDLLKYFEEINFEVIVVSAFDQYAIRAIKLDVADYILKPIDTEELVTAVSKATERIQQKKLLLKRAEATPAADQKIALPGARGLIFVTPEMILYCGSRGNYTIIYLHNGDTHLVTKQLGEYEKILPRGTFCRVHNEYLVNIDHVARYEKGRGGAIILTNGEKINVSAKKKPDFLKRYKIR